jgi:acyl-CoA synthetase (NDP forming)
MNLNNNMDLLFNPKSVAVIGASNTPGKWGFGILSHLLAKGNREVYPVNKNGGEVVGVKAYKSLREVNAPVDIALIVTPVADVPAAMEDCVYKGVKYVLIITGGFAENGKEGAEIERRVTEIARRGGVRIVGPNCMGHFDTSTDLFSLPFAMPVGKGPATILTQSGNSGLSMLNFGWQMGLGYSKYINSGNEADLHYEDYLEYLARDDKTSVILGYIEGLREGKRFLKLASEITGKKPFVVLKAGRTEDGARAARSHTAALAGSDEISDAAFKQAGVIRVEEISELVDTGVALLGQPLPGGRRVAVLTMGGGLGVIASDALRIQGLELAKLTSSTVDRLNSFLAGRWSHGNPVDPGGTHIVYPCIRTLFEDKNTDAIMAIDGVGMVGGLTGLMNILPAVKDKCERHLDESRIEEMAEIERMLELMKKYRKPVILANMVSPPIRDSEVARKLQQSYLGPYPTLERAVRALARLVEYSEYLGIARG